MERPPDGSEPGGIAGSISPEIVALGLVILLGLGGILAISNGSATGARVGTESPAATAPATPSALPNTALTPTPTPVASATAVPTAAPTATPVATPTSSAVGPSATPGATAAAPTPSAASSAASTPPVWQSAARTLVAADLRLIDRREELRAEVARKPQRSDSLAALIRATNVGTLTALGSLDALQVAGAPAALLTEIRATHQATLDAGLRTLTIALGDVAAYRKGATEVVTALEPLDAQLRALAAAAGLPEPVPPPTASPSASASAATP